jgi:hypothetical protein
MFLESENDEFPAVKTDSEGDQESDSGREKKKRTAFSSLQVMELERRFQYQRYLPKTDRRLLAVTLRLTDTQIKTWFQNRRTKWKRQQAEAMWNRQKQVEFFPEQCSGNTLASDSPPPVYLNSSPIYVLGSR